MMLTTMLVSVMVVKELISYESAHLVQMGLLAIVVFVMCLLSANKARHGKMIVSLIMAVTISACMLIIKFFFYPADPLGAGWNALLVLISSLTAGLVAGRKRARR